MKKKITKKMNPQDATLRNVRALKARLTKLEARVKVLEQRDAVAEVQAYFRKFKRPGVDMVEEFLKEREDRGQRA